MTSGDVLLEEPRIRSIFIDADQIAVLLELTIDNETFGARILVPPGASAQQDPVPGAFIISPLEPASGNMRIRRCRQIVLRFHLDTWFYEAKAQFLQVITVKGEQRAVHGGQGILISLPKALISHAKRVQKRLDIPKEMDLKVIVQKRGEKEVDGTLSDLSEGGLSFVLDVVHEAILQKGDRVGLVIQGRSIVGQPISAGSTICYLARGRDLEDINLVDLKCGAQFNFLTVAQTMQINRLIKLIQQRNASA